MEVVDLVVLGAGCAGLSFGVHLLQASKHAPPYSALFLDERTAWKRDRTWCFWSVRSHPFTAAITHEWKQWSVRFRGSTLTQSAAAITYAHVSSERFYADAIAAIRNVPQWSLAPGEQVLSVEEHGVQRPVVVRTNKRVVHAKRVIDTRPPRFTNAVPSGEIRWFQHFLGWHLRCKNAFDPQTALLMDFDVPQRPPVHFAYVLPYNHDEALIEATWFSPELLSQQQYTEAIEDYLRSRLRLSSWEILHEERGILPMSTEPLHAPARASVVRLGLAGGAARPSTGYAFLAIQRQCEAFAKALLEDLFAPCPAPHNARVQVMDRVFLGCLARDPERGAAQLFQLFERLDPALLVRFLSEESSIEDEWNVARSVPMLRFSREVFSSLPSLATKVWSART